MKKFVLPLTTAISAAMLASVGCSSDKEWQTSNNAKVCVDDSGNRIPDDRCRNQPSTGISLFRWYYISRGGYVPYFGGAVGGGSYFPGTTEGEYAPAPASAPAGAITRGGFGSFAGGHAAGGDASAGE